MTDQQIMQHINAISGGLTKQELLALNFEQTASTMVELSNLLRHGRVRGKELEFCEKLDRRATLVFKEALTITINHNNQALPQAGSFNEGLAA